MIKNKKTVVTSIFAESFHELSEEHKIWREQRLKREELYTKYGEFIEYLETSLEFFTNPIDQKKIKKQIQKLKKMQSFYQEPFILSVQFDEERMNFEEEIPVLKMKKR